MTANYSGAARRRGRIEIEKLLGVDLTSSVSKVDKSRSPRCENMVRAAIGSVKKRTGWEGVLSCPGRINGVYFMEKGGELIGAVHAGGGLYKFDISGGNAPAPLYSGMGDVKSSAANLGGHLVIFDGAGAVAFDGERAFSLKEKAYVPTVVIGRKPSGGGTFFEEANLLTPRRKESFLGDAAARDYQLSQSEIDYITVYAKKLMADGSYFELTEGPDFAVDRPSGVVSFINPPGESPVAGADNVEISYEKSVGGYAQIVDGGSVCALYGIAGARDRIFLSGGGSSNRDYYSAMDNPFYFGDMSYLELGEKGSATAAYAAVGGMLCAFKNSVKGGEAYFVSGEISASGEAEFLLKEAIACEGAVNKNAVANLGGECLYLTKKGVYALTPKYYESERNASLRSYFINGRGDSPGLLFENLLDAHFCAFGGFLIIGTEGGRIYLLDSSQVSGGGGLSRQMEGYVFNNTGARVVFTHADELYFGTDGGRICRFLKEGGAKSYMDDGTYPVRDVWETPYLCGSDPLVKKTFTYVARVLSPAVRTGDEVFAEIDGAFKKIAGQSDKARYFDFSDVDFRALTFSTDRGPRLLGDKIRLVNLQRTRFAFKNERAEPHAIEGIYVELLYGPKAEK